MSLFLPGPDIISNSSFSGVDIRVYATLSGRVNKTGAQLLDSLQTISLSSFSESVPVRGLGHRNALGWTRGPRTYAGSAIFTVVNEHPLKTLIDTAIEQDPYTDIPFSYDERTRRINNDRRYNTDSLPSINLVLIFQNEMGARASIVIYDVKLPQMGLVMSIEDMFTENTYQYNATDAIILTNTEQVQGAGLDVIQTSDVDLYDPNSISNYVDTIMGQNTTQRLAIPQATWGNTGSTVGISSPFRGVY